MSADYRTWWRKRGWGLSALIGEYDVWVTILIARDKCKSEGLCPDCDYTVDYIAEQLWAIDQGLA